MYNMTNIVQISDKTNGQVLRKKAHFIDIESIQTKEIQTIIKDMISALEKQSDGIAIAAPQIGISKQIFIVSGKVLRQAEPKYKGEENYLIFINPEIIKSSKEKQEVEEGCLSVRWKYGKIKRAEKVSLRAYNEKGEKVERGASGLLAQVFQHETDHLHGVLFIDNAYDIEDMPPEGSETKSRGNMTQKNNNEQ